MHFLPPQKSRQILPRIVPASVWSGSHYEPLSIRQPFGFSVTLSKIQHLRQICPRRCRNRQPFRSFLPRRSFYQHHVAIVCRSSALAWLIVSASALIAPCSRVRQIPKRAPWSVCRCPLSLQVRSIAPHLLPISSPLSIRAAMPLKMRINSLNTNDLSGIGKISNIGQITKIMRISRNLSVLPHLLPFWLS